MAYSAPSGDAVRISFGPGPFTPPSGDAVPIHFGPVVGTGGTGQVQSVGGSIVVATVLGGGTGQVQSVSGSIAVQRPYRFDGLVVEIGAEWGAGDRQDAGVGLGWSVKDPRDQQLAVSWARNGARDIDLEAPWSAAIAADTDVRVRWNRLKARDDQVAAPWRRLERADDQIGAPFNRPGRRDVDAVLPWGLASTPDVQLEAPWGRGARRDRQLHIRWRQHLRADQQLEIPWRGLTGMRDVFLIQPDPLPPVPPTRPCYVPAPGDGVRIAFRPGYAPANGDAVPVHFTCDIRYLFPRRSIVMSHTVTIVRLPDRTPIDAADVVVSGSRDNWCWSFQASVLTRSSFNLLARDEDGPKSVEVSIDGHTFNFLVEDPSEDRSTGQTRFSIGGRSRTALLAAPYTPPRGYANDSDISSGALAERELEFTGFTIDWQGELWTVPAGAWAYTAETPVSAILKLAEACGCIVQSHPTEDALIVSPKYPVSPWEWDAAVPDVSLDTLGGTRLGLSYKRGDRYLGVYVSGESKGVVVCVTRDGTTGSPMASMIVDPLTTDVLPGRERGRALIADAEDQETIPVVLPFADDGPGPILPTELVEVIDVNYGTFRASAMATEIRSGLENDAVVVRQTVQLARHYREPV